MISVGRLGRVAASPLGLSLATSVVVQILLLVSGVLVARALGPENRGYLAIFSTAALALAQLGSLGLPIAVTYYVASRPSQENAYLGSGALLLKFQIPIVASIHVAVLLALFGGAQDAVLRAALVTLAATPASLFLQYAAAALQGLKRFGSLNVFRVMPSLFYSLSVAFLTIAHVNDLTTISGAWVLSSFVTALIALFAIQRRSNVSGGEIGRGLRMLPIGLRGLLGNVSPFENFRLDQLLVGLVLSPRAAGLYVAALSFVNLPRFLAQSIGLVAFPTIAARDERSRHGLGWLYFAAGTVGIGVVVLALELAVPVLLPFFFGSDFVEAVAPARVLLLAAFVMAARRILADAAKGAGRAGLTTIAEISSLLVFVPMLVLTAAQGVEAAAWALVVSSAMSLAILAILNMRPAPLVPSQPLSDDGSTTLESSGD